jgi:hypothetical protein
MWVMLDSILSVAVLCFMWVFTMGLVYIPLEMVTHGYCFFLVIVVLCNMTCKVLMLLVKLLENIYNVC